MKIQIAHFLIFKTLYNRSSEAEAPILWPPDAKNWLTGKDPDVGKDWRQEMKGATEVETVGWHHRIDELITEWVWNLDI